MLFDMLFKGKNDTFLRNTASKHRVINVILTELNKRVCNALHLCNDADIDIAKFNCSKFLEIS